MQKPTPWSIVKPASNYRFNHARYRLVTRVLHQGAKAMATPGSLHRPQRRFAFSVMTPIMIYLMIFSLLPMIWAVILGFFDYSPARVGGALFGLGESNPFIGINNYIDMFGDSQPATVFRKSIINTFLFTLLVLPLNLAITLPLAIIIERSHARVKGFFRAVYFLPTVTSAVAVALIWGAIYNPQAGLLNTLIRTIGLTPPKAWLSDPQAFVFGIPLAMVALIIAHLWQDFGYNLVIFIAALQGIPQNLRDAAMVDGANEQQMFWYVTLPLLQPTLLFVCVMTILSSLQMFILAQVMTAGGPREQTTTMLMSIYSNAFRYQNMGWAAAMSMVLFGIIMLFTIVQFRFLRSDWEY
jgi:multiple sugar transport system permease protein/raffinose/stachyose/melibiose transport system permease protein